MDTPAGDFVESSDQLETVSVKRAGLVPGVQKAVAILEYLEQMENGATLTQISSNLGLPKSSVYRIVCTLVHFGYLSREPGSTLFHLGPRLLSLAKAVQTRLNLVKKSIPHLEQLRDATRETAKMSIRLEDEAMIIARVEGVGAMRVTTWVGSHFPLHAGAAGKMLLAHASTQERSRILNHDLKKFTHNTLTDRRKLDAEIDEILKRGFAQDKEEYYEGINAIACPVFDVDNTMVAAVSIPYLATQANEKRKADWLARLFGCARKISEELGHI